MVILINFGAAALKVEYTVGSQVFEKQLPPNYFVGMKGLAVSDQISNKNFLSLRGVTIFDYERNTYYNYNAATPTGATMQFMFVPNNTKPSDRVTFVAPTLASGYTQMQGLV